MNQTERIKRSYIKRIMYSYRQRFGVPADLYKVSVGTPDFKLGAKSVTLTKIHLPQFITGSVDFIRKFQYSISFVKANSNFTYGAFFEVGDRFAIVDGMYLDGIKITQKDYIVYDGKRYDPKSILELDAETGYLLHLRQIPNQVFNQIHEVHVLSNVTVEQEVGLEL